MNKLDKLNIDSLVKGYRLLKQIYVPEFKMTAVEFQHMKTNAKHIHFERDDNNKCFGVQFRTPAPNSCGVPHILEHTVLCGSQKYPVRDPFFKMLTRSQATFMNAMTASDWTLYPFSSMNNKDYLNLLSIYLDAVFRPKLDEINFMQEGWRLEPKDLSNSNTNQDFILKGVVYNEMKGVFSNSISNFAYECETNLLPKSYPYVSGGDPDAIPKLTYEQLKQFHSHLYHPSNSRFLTYGNINLEQVLEIIDDQYLSHYDPIDTKSTRIPMEPKWLQPKSIHITCQPDPMCSDANKQSYVAVNYAVDDCHDVYLNFCMQVISHLLINGDNAPLYKALIETGLGQDWISELCGFNNTTRTSSFHIGLQGVKKEDLDKVVSIIETVIKETAEEGFPKDRVESYLHQIELSLRHDKSNFGLGVILGLSYGINHETSLEELLKSLEFVKCIKKDMANDSLFLQNLIKKYLLNNSHKLTTKMTPDANYLKVKQSKEDEMIENLNQKLDDNTKTVIMDKCKKLAEAQKVSENIDCLPCLQMSDISPEVEKYPFKLDKNTQINISNTNGILYMRMMFDMSNLDSELIPYVPLFSSVITSMSTDRLNYREIDQAAESCSGGLGAGINLSGNIQSLDFSKVNVDLKLNSHCLYRNRDKMLDLWSEVINGVEFSDTARLMTLIQMEATGAWSANSLLGNAHRYAMMRANAAINPLGSLTEMWSGLEQGKFFMILAKLSEDQLRESVVPKLEKLKKVLFNTNQMRIALNMESEVEDDTLSLVELFKQNIPTQSFTKKPLPINSKQFPRQSHIVLPYTVNYAASSVKSVEYKHADFAKVRVLSKLMSSKFLLREIREIGGAYGGGAICSPGYFTFYSYRDPHNLATFDRFIKSFEWVIKEELSQQLLNESKLSVFQETDRPVSAGNHGSTHFYDGVTDEIRQEARERVFAVSLDDLKTTASWLANESKSNVLIGPEFNQEGESKDQNEWTKIEFS